MIRDEGASPFHPGEIAVQARAGVRSRAEQVGRMIRADVPPELRQVLAACRLLVLGTADPRGRHVWASALTGPSGFVRAGQDRVDVRGLPRDGRPLRVEQRVALLAMDPSTRRRVRINGHVTATDSSGFIVATHEVYGNCRRFVTARTLAGPAPAAGSAQVVHAGDDLGPAHRRWIEQADTFFIATVNPGGDLDASHRGGSSGFVRVLGARSLRFPDYAGNSLFNTLGNLVMDPRAGLLFCDFTIGHTLQLTGTAAVNWDPEHAASMPGAERVVDVHVDAVVESRGVLPQGESVAPASASPRDP